MSRNVLIRGPSPHSGMHSACRSLGQSDLFPAAGSHGQMDKFIRSDYTAYFAILFSRQIVYYLYRTVYVLGLYFTVISHLYGSRQSAKCGHYYINFLFCSGERQLAGTAHYGITICSGGKIDRIRNSASISIAYTPCMFQ